tara:strand:+ start:607 stop:2193 length:1587 start_codon:yes stop_codon:yes gene_type:complete
MAVPFFNNNSGNSGKSSGGMGSQSSRRPGYDPRTILDASIIANLTSTGYILTPTSYNASTDIGNFQQIRKSVIGGKTIPALQDRAGNVYVMDERNVIYLLEKSRINPNTGAPAGAGTPGPNSAPAPSTPTQGSTPQMGPPLIYNGPTGNGGGYIPPAPPGGTIGSGKIYTQFAIDDIVPNQQEIVTRALWSNNVGNLTTFYTSSAETATQKRYYYEIWNSGSQGDCGAQPQFSIAYGNKLGSGSNDEGGQIEDTPSRAIYGQNRLLCLDQDTETFTIDGTSTDSIYVINVNRARMREYLDEGNIEINLAHLSGSEFIAGGNPADAHTGSNVALAGNGSVLRLIDDSSLNPATIMQSGEVYNIVSGSIEDGIYNSSSPDVYGLLFRRKGIMILDATRLDVSASFATVTGREVPGDNSMKLFTAISGAAQYDDGSGDPLGFAGRGAEKVKSTHYFVRAKNAEYNFSNNPTFITGSEGDLRHPSMYSDPKSYITTVGLYNPSKELVAVAKLSQAQQKSFTKEALIEVKLEF